MYSFPESLTKLHSAAVSGTNYWILTLHPKKFSKLLRLRMRSFNIPKSTDAVPNHCKLVGLKERLWLVRQLHCEVDNPKRPFVGVRHSVRKQAEGSRNVIAILYVQFDTFENKFRQNANAKKTAPLVPFNKRRNLNCREW
jgi:hypothetical protein